MSCSSSCKKSCETSDYLVCTCMGVMFSDITQAIESGKDTYTALQDALGVGTGCNSCVEEVREILQEYEKEAAACKKS